MKKTLVIPVLIKSKTEEGSLYRIVEKFDSDTRVEELYWERRHKRDVPYHLYFIAPDARIVDGDYVYVEEYPQVWEFKKAPCPLPYWGNADEAFKIVASTDKSLGLPAVPRTVLNAYILKQGNLDTLTIMGGNEIEINDNNEVKMIAHGVHL